MSLRRAIKYRAKQAKITQSDLSIACEVAYSGRIVDACKRIRDSVIARGGKITHAQARARLDAALPTAARIIEDIQRGESRREASTPSPNLSVKERLDAAVCRFPLHLGGGYSGDTEWRITHGAPGAHTSTSKGVQYSRRCTWRKTDATHYISAQLSGLRRVREAGLPISCPRDKAVILDCTLIREEEQGRIFLATVVVEKNKSIHCESKYIADQGDGMLHFGKTERGALLALKRSAQESQALPSGNITSTKLQRANGWCAAGIRNWCESHGIRRNLRVRLRRGAKPKAVARLIAKHGGPRDYYEKRLLTFLAAE